MSLRFKRLAPLGLLWCSLGVTPAAHAAVVLYDPSLGTLPEAQGWTRREGGPVAPAPFVSGGVLHQGPTTTSGHQYWENAGATYNFATTTVTVDMRLRITSSSFNAYPRGGYTVVLSDSAGRLGSLYIASGAVFLGNDQTNSVSSIVPFDSTDGFHDYRLELGPSGYQLSIDSVPIVSLALGAVTSPANLISFGDGTLLAGSESDLLSFVVSNVTLLAVPMPEPASALALALGIVGLAGARLRRVG